MKRFLQGFAAGSAVLVVLGMVATAASGSRADPSDVPTPTVAPSTPSEEPSESEAPETEKPEAKGEATDRPSGSPDFSACDGLTGLNNATCRHTALLKLQPANTGLANAMSRLQANADRHATPPSHAGS
jgi:hypothetical protein